MDIDGFSIFNQPSSDLGTMTQETLAFFHPGTARIFIAGFQSRRSLKSRDAPLSPVAAKKNSS